MAAPDESSDGRRQIAGGVIASWGAQIIQIAAGFVIPRWIDHGLGRETLGIWDLAWSVVSYLTLLEGGIGSSVNRHVALYRVKADVNGVNRVVSSVALVQRAIAGLILVLAIAFALALPFYLSNVTPSLIVDVRWLVLLLGSSVAFSLSGSIYTGVLTGCHRWVTHHIIYASTNLLSAIGMCCALKAGFGIVALAAVHMGTEILGRLLRILVAYRACPGLSIRIQNADVETIRTMTVFGGRMFVGRVSQIFMVQTVSVLIAGHLGPAALALFARPRSLIRQASVFPQKYAFMLAPAAAALSSRGNAAELKRFVTESTRYGICLAFPIMVFLAIDGGSLIRIWMGNAYADSSLITLLAIGFTADVVYQPLSNLLLGLNLHGRPGFFSLIAAVCAVSLVYAALLLGLGMNGIALAIGVPWSIVHGIYLPYYTCRRLRMPVRTFLKDVWARPICCAVPFALCVFSGRWVFPAKPIPAIAMGGLSGITVLLALYWLWIFPEASKSRLRKTLGLSAPSNAVTASAEPKLEATMGLGD